MSIGQFLEKKTLFITGATGFLGQPLVEKILWAAPNVGRIYVLIRPKKQFGGRVLTAQRRIERELYRSSVFDRLRATYGAQCDVFLRKKVIAVAGDIAKENLGVDLELCDRLRNEVDIVVNSAAVVSFDAPLDEALELNVFGAERTAQFALSCRDAILIHVSTAYVCGATSGVIPETLHQWQPNGKRTLRKIQDVNAEINELKAIVAQVKEVAGSAALGRKLEAEFDKARRLKRTSRRNRRLGDLQKTWLAETLAAEGMKRARERGWNDTYTYTKAIGEIIVAETVGGLPTTIIRPSVIESSLAEPSPGWLDGLRMADPLIVAIGKGRLRALPLNPLVCLDLVPADMVVNAILAALPQTRRQKQISIYQVATGSENPVNLGDLYKLIHAYFASHPMLDRDAKPIKIKPLRFPKPETFRLQHRLKAMPLGTAEKTLQKLSLFDATQRARRKISARRVAHDKLYYYGEIYGPYLNLNCRFEVKNLLSLCDELSEEERKEFNFDVTRINWRHYIQNIHIPGVKKYILKIEGTGSFELEEESDSARPFKTIPELLYWAARRYGAKPALQIKRDGEWAGYSYRDLADKAGEIGERLSRLGCRKGDRVVLFSENQPEWCAAYLGASSRGIIVVPIDSQTWHREVWSVAEFTGARAILASERCIRRLPEESIAGHRASRAPKHLLNVDDSCRPFVWDQAQPPEAEAAAAMAEPILPDDPASIIFTTGTTVDPKGAVHTHRNFLNNLVGVEHHLSVEPGDQFLSVLPLYHALEFSCGFLMALYGGATVTYVKTLKPKGLLETMRETGTTCMLGVPTLFALIREDIERRILKSAGSTLRSNLLARGKQLSHSWEERFGKNIGKKIFARVHEEFGGKVRLFVSGGSALGEDLFNYFRALGMPIYEGYGLTETAPVLTVNPKYQARQNSAGKPLPGVELRLYHPDRDGVGEIIVKSPSLMQGYYQNSAATERAMQDGWFHTGDLGWVDSGGYIYITGRMKDVIVTGAGKNVYPTDLEAIYAELPSIDEICVVGVKSGLTEDVHAVVFPAADMLGGVKPEHWRKTIQGQTQKLAKELPSYHRLQALHLVEERLPRRADGELDRRKIATYVTERRRDRPNQTPLDTGNTREVLLAELSRLSGEETAEISLDSNLYTDLGLDSLMALELLLFLEQELSVVVSDEQAAAFQTVGDLLEELKRHQLMATARHNGVPEGPRSVLPLGERPPLDRAIMKASFLTIAQVFRTYFRLSVKHAGRVPREGPYILAPNHSSHLDTGAVIAALTSILGVSTAQRLHVIGARDYFFDRPIKGLIFSCGLNLVPIERDEVSLGGLRMVRYILNNGEPVLIFPEGTRSRNGRLAEFKPGIGLIAWENNVPIIPVYIEGTHGALPPGKGFPRRREVVVSFGEPVRAIDYNRDGSEPLDEVYRQITAAVQSAVVDLAERRTR